MIAWLRIKIVPILGNKRGCAGLEALSGVSPDRRSTLPDDAIEALAIYSSLG
jgi:hypothetical protein